MQSITTALTMTSIVNIRWIITAQKQKVNIVSIIKVEYVAELSWIALDTVSCQWTGISLL